MIESIKGSHSTAVQMSLDNREVRRDIPCHGRCNIPRILRPTLTWLIRCSACWLCQSWDAQASSRDPSFLRKEKLHLKRHSTATCWQWCSKRHGGSVGMRNFCETHPYLKILSAARSSVTTSFYFVDFKTHSWAFKWYKNSLIWRSVTSSHCFSLVIQISSVVAWLLILPNPFNRFINKSTKMASKDEPTPTDASLTDLEVEKEVAVQSLAPPSEFTYVYLRVVFLPFLLANKRKPWIMPHCTWSFRRYFSFLL